jgi:hypothetical protein
MGIIDRGAARQRDRERESKRESDRFDMFGRKIMFLSILVSISPKSCILSKLHNKGEHKIRLVIPSGYNAKPCLYKGHIFTYISLKVCI